jgi:hypothetical protein
MEAVTDVATCKLLAEKRSTAFRQAFRAAVMMATLAFDQLDIRDWSTP